MSFWIRDMKTSSASTCYGQHDMTLVNRVSDA